MDHAPQHITIPQWTCLRCGHVWVGRIERPPARCPKCSSPRWNTPRRTPKAAPALTEKMTQPPTTY